MTFSHFLQQKAVFDLQFFSQKHPDLASLQAQSTGEDSNSSDGQASDRDEDGMDGLNGSMDHNRSSFPSAFLSLQGIPLMPGPSVMHNDNFGECRLFFISI